MRTLPGTREDELLIRAVAKPLKEPRLCFLVVIAMCQVQNQQDINQGQYTKYFQGQAKYI